MSLGIDPEEAAALAVLDSLGRLQSPDDTSVPEPEDEIDLTLRRMYGDAIGLLAYSLDPVTPSPGLRSSILSQTIGDSTQEVEPIHASTPSERRPAPPALVATPIPPRTVAVRPALAALDSGARESARPVALPERSERRRSSPRGWAALAATLTFTLIGAGFWIAYLQSELAAQGARLAWAEKEWKGEAASARAELKELNRRLTLVTSPAVTVFHLRCPSGSGPGATANANVYVSADRKQWELEVQGLASQPPEREYQLWFMVGGETRSGGCFTMQDGEVALLNPASFPPGTTGIAISLEPKGGSMRPTSPPILVSTEPVRL